MNEEIKKACQVMREGGVILYPTDTIWGIGCDATNEEAVRRVYEIKHRADSKAMLVLVDSAVKVDFYVQDVPEVAWDLIELADKPLTIIYSGAATWPPTSWPKTAAWVSASRARNSPSACASSSAKPSFLHRPMSADSLRHRTSAKSAKKSSRTLTIS